MVINKCFNELEVYNKILWETENFKVIPSLGALVEGWLLIIPKSHYICYGRLTDSILREELDFLIQYTSEIIQKEYGNYIIFEHGPVEEKSKVGCGVDYAHLHILPINLTLEKVKAMSDQDFQWNEVKGLNSTSSYIDTNQPYLYFKDNHKNSYIGTSTTIPSQFFRRIIASIINRPEMFDWKKYSFLENIEKTFSRLVKYNEMVDIPKLATYA